MNAINLLVSEHDKVRKILAAISVTDNFTAKRDMFKTLRHDLLRHEKMEQQVWYPHFKNLPGLDGTVKHLIKEEKEAHHEIIDLNHFENEKDWDEKFKKFKSDVEHHASEEESLLFPQINKLLSSDELEKIGKEMAEFEREYELG